MEKVTFWQRLKEGGESSHVAGEELFTEKEQHVQRPWS